MKLSIIIPVFNGEKFITQCLDPIVNELTCDDELIIVNDGSFDNTLTILDKYKSNNVLIFSNENHGVSYSRNFGLQKACGQYVMFCDADDYLSPNWRSKLKVGIDSGKEIVYFYDGNYTKKELFDSVICFNDFKVNNFAFVNSRIFDREFLIKNDIKFSTNLINGEDALFNLEALNKTESFYFLSGGIYNYRIHANSATHKYNEKFIKTDLLFSTKLKGYLTESKIFTTDEILERVNYCMLNGIFINAYRIALCKNINYQYFNDILVCYNDFFESYDGTILSKRNNKIFYLLKKGKFKKIVKKIRLREKLANIYKKANGGFIVNVK